MYAGNLCSETLFCTTSPVQWTEMIETALFIWIRNYVTDAYSIMRVFAVECQLHCYNIAIGRRNCRVIGTMRRKKPSVVGPPFFFLPDRSVPDVDRGTTTRTAVVRGNFHDRPRIRVGCRTFEPGGTVGPARVSTRCKKTKINTRQ